MHQRTKIALAVAMAMNSLTVFAQTADLQRVEVTGSRIRQVDLETAVDPELPIDRFVYVRYNQSF
jgi:iron complex outermembrane receptor protein